MHIEPCSDVPSTSTEGKMESTNDDTVKTNHQLAARVAIELDEAVEHPKGVQVFADDGEVILRGVALRDEIDELIDTAEHVAGVAEVTNQLDVVESPGNVEPLQG